MKALVVDDEPPARRRLARMLSALPDVSVVGELDDAESLLAALAEASPDVVFLDVCMPGLDGVSLAQRHQELPPVVFVTAYDQYAVRAFDVDAVDYLLKPVRAERLAAAIARVRARATAAARARENVARVVSTTRGTRELFDPAAITRFWASQKYTLFIADGDERLTEEPLSALEARLSAHGFVRVHRGELIRVGAVRALQRCADGHEALLSDGQRVRVSRRSLGTLRAALDRLGG